MAERLSLSFTGTGHVGVRSEPLPQPADDEVLVQTVVSGISAGTELQVYRGQKPPDLPTAAWPLKYGYAAVGRVLATGGAVDPAWRGRMVFALHSHESHFTAKPESLVALPQDLAPEDAVFLANMETAVNFVMDGRPMIGECVAVLGQGVVGLLTTSLLGKFPLAKLITVDSFAVRRERSLATGADASLDSTEAELIERIRREIGAERPSEGADLVYELSGDPGSLNAAIDIATFDGRIVVGSWYGAKEAPLNLGGRFHTNRLRLISSQVSTIAPEIAGRWDKARRFGLALRMLEQVKPSQFITHRFPLTAAAEAYELLHRRPEEAIQVIFEYDV